MGKLKKLIKKAIMYFIDEELKVLLDKNTRLQNEVNSLKSIQPIIEENKKLRDELKNILGSLDVSVDVHEHRYEPSWACISLQGSKNNYIKFVDLGDSEIRDIESFLRQYENRSRSMKIDANPSTRRYLMNRIHRF